MPGRVWSNRQIPGRGAGAGLGTSPREDARSRAKSQTCKGHSGKIGGPPPWPKSRRPPDAGRALRRLVELMLSKESIFYPFRDRAHPPPPERKSRPGVNRSGNPQPKPAVLAGPVRRFKDIT